MKAFVSFLLLVLFLHFWVCFKGHLKALTLKKHIAYFHRKKLAIDFFLSQIALLALVAAVHAEAEADPYYLYNGYYSGLAAYNGYSTGYYNHLNPYYHTGYYGLNVGRCHNNAGALVPCRYGI